MKLENLLQSESPASATFDLNNNDPEHHSSVTRSSMNASGVVQWNIPWHASRCDSHTFVSLLRVWPTHIQLHLHGHMHLQRMSLHLAHWRPHLRLRACHRHQHPRLRLQLQWPHLRWFWNGAQWNHPHSIQKSINFDTGVRWAYYALIFLPLRVGFFFLACFSKITLTIAFRIWAVVLSVGNNYNKLPTRLFFVPKIKSGLKLFNFTKCAQLVIRENIYPFFYGELLLYKHTLMSREKRLPHCVWRIHWWL